MFLDNHVVSTNIHFTLPLCGDRIMDHEKRLSILYQKQGRATQFANKADRDDWLQKEIKDLEAVLVSNIKQVSTDWFFG